MKILKLPHGFCSPGEFVLLAEQKGIMPNQKFCMRFKSGTRWKLKAFRGYSYYEGNCECCGGYTSLTLHRADKHFSFDNHLGNGNVSDIASQIKVTK